VFYQFRQPKFKIQAERAGGPGPAQTDLWGAQANSTGDAEGGGVSTI